MLFSPRTWQRLSDAPTPALSGRYAGISRGALLLAGGSYFPRSLFEGGTKVLSDRVDVLEHPDGRWKFAGRLPRPLGQGATVTDATGIVCVGGADLTHSYREVFRLRWSEKGRLERDTLPPLPVPAAFGGAALIGDSLYATCGIESPTATTALNGLWRLSLRSNGHGERWESLPPCPGPGRLGAAVTTLDDVLYVIGGASLKAGADGKPARTYLRDAWRWNPTEGWRRLADLPYPLVAAPIVADTAEKRLLLFGGDDGVNAARAAELKDRHPGFRHDILAYDPATNRWSAVPSSELAPLPIGLVTTSAVRWQGAILLPGGEDRPGHRSSAVFATALPVPQGASRMQNTASSSALPASLTRAPLFKSGTDGYHTFRIPALLVTKQGTLLAFAEGRKNGGGDSGKIDLVVKRSTDKGHTWGPLQVVWADGENTCGNPCPVVDQESGAIHLLMTHNLGEDHEKQINDGTSKSTRTVWVTRSSDDGKTWDTPRDITATTKQKEWRWYATGPGVGIQVQKGKYKGRLVIPCDHNAPDGNGSRSHAIYSDDGGKTWAMGETVPQTGMNECQVAELSDGRLMLNMRGSDKARNQRGVAISPDGGKTWPEYRDDSVLVEPVCQASLIAALFEGRPALLFSNPADGELRRNMTVRVSLDDGKTWPLARPIHDGPAAYSCLAALGPDTFACLYECGDTRPYETITLAHFTTAWLRG